MGIVDSIDLNPNHLATVKSILAEHVPECEVRAFGSRATWTARDYSDLDLAVVGEEPIDWRTLGRLKEAFEESALPMRVDVLDWHTISESFQEVVERDYEVVQEGALDATARGAQHKRTLGDVAQITMGQSPPGHTVSSDHGVALLNGPTEFGTHHPTPVQFTTNPRKRTQPGDLLFCVRGSTTGRMNWADQEYAIGRGVAAIHHRDDPSLQPLVRGVIEVELPELLIQATGSTFPNVSARQLASIPYPNLSGVEQGAIAHVLGTLDDKIELNRRMNETLEEMARALFKSWFVDFDPVRAKMDGRWRQGESLPGLPADLYDLFPNRLVPSELGEIPEGWEVKALGEVAHLNPESWPNKNSPTDVEYVDLANTKWGVIESTQHFLWEDAPSRAKRILRPGDTILGTVRPGNGSYALIGTHGLTGSTGFAVLRPSHRRFRELVYSAVTAPDNIERLAHRADGAAYPAVRPEVVAETKTAMPVEQTSALLLFSSMVGTILDRMEHSRTETDSLAAQRDTLLPKLLLGEVPF